MKFVETDFKDFNITPELLAIINDAEQVDEICEMSEVEVDAAKIRFLIKSTFEYVSNVKDTVAEVNLFIHQYLFETAELIQNETDMRKYCTYLFAMNEFTKYIK